MLIGNRSISRESPPFIVAEMSGNHNQSLERALDIVAAAAKSGAHAIKLQTYTADTMTLNIDRDEFVIRDERSLWNGQSLHGLYSQAYTPWDWHQPIMERAEKLGLMCFSSPFDESAVDFLETLDVPAYKIASFELIDLPLIRKVAATGKPVIMSTGMATLGEIHDAVEAARAHGCRELVLLKCTSTYPASPDHSNVLTLPHLRTAFGCQVGISDHTMGVGTAIAAVAHGATLVEKHFTLRRSDGGVDSAFSLEPHEMAILAEESVRAWQSLGTVSYGPTDDGSSLKLRRSVYVARDLRLGDVISRSDLRIVRPGLGLPPKSVDDLVGLRTKQEIKAGTPASWDLFR